VNLDLKSIVNRVAPWDFSITIERGTFATVRPTIGFIVQLQAAFAVGKKIRPEEMQAAINGMFAEPDVPLSGEEMTGAVVGYMQYFSQVASKNFGAIADAAKDAMASPEQK
jgi:hypothetical protein